MENYFQSNVPTIFIFSMGSWREADTEVKYSFLLLVSCIIIIIYILKDFDKYLVKSDVTWLELQIQSHFLRFVFSLLFHLNTLHENLLFLHSFAFKDCVDFLLRGNIISTFMSFPSIFPILILVMLCFRICSTDFLIRPNNMCLEFNHSTDAFE